MDSTDVKEYGGDKVSFGQIVDALPQEQRSKIINDVFQWKLQTDEEYRKFAGIEDGGSQIRDFTCPDDVRQVFRESIMWWQKKKPILAKGEVFNTTEIFKTRIVLGEIKSLTMRLPDEITLESLNLQDHK